METPQKDKLREEYKKLANFIGWTYRELDVKKPNRNNPGWYKKHIIGSEKLLLENFITRKTLELAFRYNWNNLMEVVEKIESLEDSYHGGFNVTISSDSCLIQSKNIGKGGAYSCSWHASNDKIKATYLSVLRFVDFYSNN